MTVTVTHTKVSAIPDGADTTVVRPSDWNATHTLVGLGTAAELDAGVANGVATLDASGKVPSSQLTGVVTSVTGTAPVVSSGGATPAISMAAATAVVDGYLTATDWSTFNSKQAAGAYLTTVTSDAPLTGSGTSASHLSIPAATASVNGYLTSADWTTFNNKGSGTVTSVSGTAPVVSTGGATPVISMAAATASVNGYLTSADWTTFNSKGSGTVTSVSATSPVTSSGGATPTIAIPAATASVNGYLTSADWTTFNNKGSGSVTSVAATVPSFLSITGTPITSSGTLAISYSGTALPIANGGTGLTALGTGVQTAIGVNIGTAGAFVVNGGALGTPSSGTVTNLTGTASININGTVGATTPTTGAFTTLSATGVTTVQAGTAALPAIVSTTGTADTGIFFPAADTVAASTAGTERLRINSSGNVGIGTSSPTQVLTVIGGGQAIYFGSSTRGIMSQDNGTRSTLLAVNPAVTAYHPLTIDATNIQFSNSATVAMTITSSNVGIGTASPNYKLEISTDSAGKPGVGGLWTVVSDERIKSNIVPANLDRCYEIVKSVPLKHFGFAEGVYSDDQIQDKHNLGWIAQDVQKVFKNAVSVKPFTPATGDVIEDCLDLNGGQMIAALYGAVQALMAIVDTQAARITALEKGV